MSDGWFNLLVFITECTTGVQPHPALEPNQPDLGQVRLLKPPIKQTHCTLKMFGHLNTLSTKVML